MSNFVCTEKEARQIGANLLHASIQLTSLLRYLQLRNLKEKLQNRQGQNLNKEIWIRSLRKILQDMKKLNVLVELFNRCFPFVILAFKICFLTCAIIDYFFSIRHFHDHPLLASYTGYHGTLVTVVYTIMYEHAFSVPAKMEDLKKEFLLVAKTLTSTGTSRVTKTTRTTSSQANSNAATFFSCSEFNQTQTQTQGQSQGQGQGQRLWREMEREMKGIQDVGIKVGRFYVLERESTPNFIDFVVRNVVNLLVAFPSKR